MSEIDSVILSVCKGIGFIFIPSIVVNQLVFNEMLSINMLVVMLFAMILSGIMIYEHKKNVEEEVICMNNAYMQMRIVLILTLFIIAVQILQLI